MATRAVTTDDILAQIPAARRRARRQQREQPHALTARFDRTHRRLCVTLTNGAALTIPVDLIATLRDAANPELAEVSITAAGIGLHWPRLDHDLTLASIARLAFGTRVLLRASGAAGGASTSAAKSRAARENGRKGGRPRTQAIGTD